MKSIKSKLTIITAIIVIISLGFLSFTSYLKARSTLISNIEDSVSLQSAAVSKQLDLWLIEHKTELEMIASSPVIINEEKMSDRFQKIAENTSNVSIMANETY